ncbi:MAG: ATP-binding protein [Pseudomonadota bacterium]
MDKENDNKSTGLNGLNGESKAEFLRLIWNGTTYQMCLAKMVFNDHGAPVDYIILDINPAYEKAFGFARGQAINKRVTELFPYYTPKWIEKCGEAVRLGKNIISVEHIYEPYLWYEIQVFPLGSGDQFITIAQDITKHNEEKIRIENDINTSKIANEALNERVELLNVLMDYNPSLIFLKDECGRYVYVNKTYEQQFVGSKDWYGKTDFDFWSKESAELFRANDQAVLETGRVTQYLEDSKDLEGTRYCWLNYKFPYTDSKNRRYSGGIGIDVTKRILTEEALRKAEEELQHYAEELKKKEEEAMELVDSFTEGSWIVDRLTGTIKCSEKWSKRIGLDRVSEKERLSYTHTLVHPEDTAEGNSIEHCIETGLTRFELEYRVKTVDSGYIWTQNRGKIVYDPKGKAIKVYAATIDITERKRAEEVLRDSEQRQTFLLKLSDELRPLSDAIEIQRTAMRIVGEYLEVDCVMYNEITGDGKTIHIEDNYVRNGFPKVMGDFPVSSFGSAMEILRKGEILLIDDQTTTPLKKPLEREASTSLQVYASATVPLIKNGRWVANFGVLHGRPRKWIESEITILQETAERTWAAVQRAQTEEALRESEEKAKSLVVELEKADTNKNQFISVLSHELRNPLASITASLALMDRVPQNAEKQTAKALEIAKRQGKQLTNLVDDLLDITRITQNKIVLKKERLELNELINKTLQDYHSKFIDKNVKLEVRSTEPLYIEADYSRLTQTFGNLLDNAAKFTHNYDLVTVTAFHETNSNEAVITVQDTGRGIDPNVIENLFEPFMQVDKTLDRTYGGLGLGLAIVKGMVELHGGRVEAFSEGIGKGTKFTIRLPLPKENLRLQEGCEKSDTKANKSGKILMIDDNKDLAAVMCELIHFSGNEAVSAHNGTEGIAKARELRPDVIICDIGLPDMSGYEVAQLIRRDTDLQDTVLIALSGYVQPEDIERSKAAGFDRHLGKPLSLETLQIVLNEVK